MAQPIRIETIDHDSAMDDTADAVKVLAVGVNGLASEMFGRPTRLCTWRRR